jgi:hypothetical protein
MVSPDIAASEAPSTSADGLVAEARDQVAKREYEQAVRRMRAAISLEPNNDSVVREVRAMESEIRAELEGRGVEAAGIPVLKASLQDMQTMDFSPQEAFLLSRITGTTDIGSILKISPLPELEALVVFWKLLDGDLIDIGFG